MLDYDMSQRGDLTRYEYLYRCVRDDILSGELAAGDRLPSKRALATHLEVALVTVESAYAQLVAEGFVTARPRSGYYVNLLPQTSSALQRSAASPMPSVRADRQTEQQEGAPLLADFSRPATRVDSSAANLWERALRQTITQEPRTELFAAQPVQGTERLRAAIADYLHRSRGVAVSPCNIVVGAGAQVIYQMIVCLLGRAPVAVEDPGYGRVWATYAAGGCPVRFVRADEEGMRVDLLAQTDAAVAHVMPSHQFPTGRVTSAARRFELLGWASAEGDRHIVEDDYDCEFRMSGVPVPPLVAADTAGRVLYVNTFSKSLSSALRLAYLVLPDGLVPLWHERLGFLACTVSVIDQVALARLLESGDYDRHVARYRTQQRRLRDEFLDALAASAVGPRLAFEEADSGLHFVLAVEADGDAAEEESRIAREALAQGIRLAPLGAYAHEHAALPADGYARFVMQYDGLDPKRVERVAEAIAAAI